MTLVLDDFESFKREYEAARREADRVEGALRQVLLELEQAEGVADLKSAKKLLKKLRQELVGLAEEYNNEFAKVKVGWPGVEV